MTPESMRAQEQAGENTIELKSKLQETVENDAEILKIIDDMVAAKNELAQTTEPAAIQRLNTKIKTLELFKKEREQAIRDQFFTASPVKEQTNQETMEKKEWTEDEVADALERAHQRGL